MSKRNISIGKGNYNENIEGDYIEGNKVDNSVVDNSDNSRHFQVGDVGGDFNPTNSSIMSDGNKISVKTKTEKPEKKGKLGLILTVAAIVIGASVSGLFNEEIREILNLNKSSETQEQREDQPK